VVALSVATACAPPTRLFGTLDPDGGNHTSEAGSLIDAATSEVSATASGLNSSGPPDDAALGMLPDGSTNAGDGGPGETPDGACGRESAACVSPEDTGVTLDATDDAQTVCSGCQIDGACVADGKSNPDNACEVCDPKASDNEWSPNAAGNCDDGLFCDGSESCSGAKCVRTDPPCADSACSEDLTQCCEPTAETVCGTDGDVHVVDTCGQTIDAPSDTCTGGCQLGACSCVVRVNSGGSDTNDGATWAGAKRTVTGALDAAAASGCEVWVREGTYTPGYEQPASSCDRVSPFSEDLSVRKRGAPSATGRSTRPP
jgi:hypothetical protein